MVDEEIDIEELTNEIIDWLDHDNDSRSEILLTEEDVYRRAGSTYRPANRPVNSIGELAHVLGMTPQVMKTTIGLCRILARLRRLDHRTLGSVHSALTNSPIGGYLPGTSKVPELSKININTCPPELLTAMFGLNGQQRRLGHSAGKTGIFPEYQQSTGHWIWEQYSDPAQSPEKQL